MISKVEVRKNVIAYLEERNRNYQDLDSVTKIRLERQQEVRWGQHKGKIDDIFVLNYQMSWGLEMRSIFVHVSATTGEVLYSSGPHGMLEENEEAENPKIERQKAFVESIFGDVFKEGDFSFGEGSEIQLLYESYEYNLEFRYDSRYGDMVYGGMYIRLLENDNLYRLNELVEFFDSEKRSFKEITKSLQEQGLIDLRIHEAVIKSHLMTVLTNKDISWEDDFKKYLSAKQPY